MVNLMFNNLWTCELTSLQKELTMAQVCPHRVPIINGINSCDVIMDRVVVNRKAKVIYCKDVFKKDVKEFYCPYDSESCDGKHKLCNSCIIDLMEMPML